MKIIIITSFLIACCTICSATITIQNIGPQHVHCSYEDKFGRIIGIWVTKESEKLIDSDVPIRLAFDHLMELYPIIIFPNQKIVVKLSNNKPDFFQKDYAWQKVYILLEQKHQILKSTFSGINYNNNIKYNYILEAIKSKMVDRLKFIETFELDNKHSQIYKEIVYAKYVDELQSPMLQLGYSNNLIPLSYRLEVNIAVDSLFKLIESSKTPSLIKQYLLSAIRFKTSHITTETKRVDFQYSFISSKFQPPIANYLFVKLLTELENNGYNVDSLISRVSSNCKDPDILRYLSELMKNKKRIFDEGPLNKTPLSTVEGKELIWETLPKLYKGKVLYIDLWASWCKPCIEEMDASIKLAKNFADRNVIFAYISVDKDVEKWEASIFKHKLVGANIVHYNLKENSQLASLLTNGSIPKHLLVDSEGVVITKDGPGPNSSNVYDILSKLITKTPK